MYESCLFACRFRFCSRIFLSFYLLIFIQYIKINVLNLSLYDIDLRLYVCHMTASTSCNIWKKILFFYKIVLLFQFFTCFTTALLFSFVLGCSSRLSITPLCFLIVFIRFYHVPWCHFPAFLGILNRISDVAATLLHSSGSSLCFFFL